ncbi:MAG: hypothetical protein ACK4YP_05930, partial [Myxococcota bacterium]
PWKDFTGGSALFLDLSTVDWTTGRNVIAPAEGGEGVAATAIDLPSFTGDMAYAESRDLLVVANRLSEGARTREAKDAVWFVDVSDPDAPALAEIAPDGASLEVGWDPVGVHYAPSTDMAWVVNRTAHTVGMIDLSADPVALVPPGGPARLDASAYIDADASGSRAGFVTLAVTEEEDIDLAAREWSLRWGIGAVRLWVPGPAGAFRVTGNGETLWDRSNVPADLDLDDADGEVLAVNDPAYLTDADDDGAFARIVFEDQGALRGAYTRSGLESWNFESVPLLEGSGGWDATIGGPHMLRDGGSWYLFYDGTDGGNAAIGLATSSDGVDFDRVAGPVFAIDGAAVTDPFVLRDAETDRWRMYATRDGGAIVEAWSEDLVDWTEAGTWAPEGGASAPSVGYWNGAFHLFYTDGAGVLTEAVSLDGSEWSVVGPVPGLDADAVTAGGVALQVAAEEAYTFEDQGGTVLPATLAPGEEMDSDRGWEIRVAVGQVADPDDVGAASVELGSIAGGLAFLTYTDDAGASTIGVGLAEGAELVLDATPVLEAGAGGDHDADAVRSPVAFEADAGFVMYYAAEADGLTTIGRATSPDGYTWTADAAPVLTPAVTWEGATLEPGSVQVLDDGTVRLWYSAFDGTRWRVGLAESTDGVSFSRVPGVQYDWVFDAGAPGEWYDTGVRHPWVVRDGNVDRMWFVGDSGEVLDIGYAEREGDTDEWSTATDLDGNERPVLTSGLGGFGVDGVTRPVVLAEDGGWTLWYTGVDAEQGRVGRAFGAETDRFHRDLRMPSLADTWSFTSVPAREGETLSLDVTVDGSPLSGGGCSGVAEDEDRGFLYVGCKLVPYLYVIDIRDDSTADFDDLNYLDVEGVILVETSTGSGSGLRALLMDRARGWLWGVSDAPEALYAVDLSRVVDDADSEILREEVVAMLPVPRTDRDEGVPTESVVGPGALAMHPDGKHLFVTNYNDNSVSVYDLSLGPTGTLVAERDAVGENPYAIVISADGTLAAVGNYSGEVDGGETASTIALLDADPTSPTFLEVKTWLVNK